MQTLHELMAKTSAKRVPEAQECLLLCWGSSDSAESASPSCVLPWGSAGCTKEARRWSKSKICALSVPPSRDGWAARAYGLRREARLQARSCVSSPLSRPEGSTPVSGSLFLRLVPFTFVGPWHMGAGFPQTAFPCDPDMTSPPCLAGGRVDI